MFIVFSMGWAYSQCFDSNLFNPSNNSGRKVFSFYFPLSDEETKAHVYISEKKQNQIFSSGTPENILLYCLKNETDRTGWRDCIQSDQHTVQLIKNTQWTGVTLTTANNIFVDWESEITGGVTDPSRHPPLLRSKGSFKV